MIADDEDQYAPDDDERARRAAAAELQEQIDALVRGDAGALPARPRSLREFIEYGDKRRPSISPPPPNAPDEAASQQPDEAGGKAGKDD